MSRTSSATAYMLRTSLSGDGMKYSILFTLWDTLHCCNQEKDVCEAEKDKVWEVDAAGQGKCVEDKDECTERSDKCTKYCKVRDKKLLGVLHCLWCVRRMEKAFLLLLRTDPPRHPPVLWLTFSPPNTAAGRLHTSVQGGPTITVDIQTTEADL